MAAPGIDPPTGISLKPYRKARAQNQIRLSGFKDELLLQGSASSKVDYVVQEEVTGAESLLKHYIGIYDPESGDLQLVPARNMVMRGVIRTEEEDEDVEQTPESVRCPFSDPLPPAKTTAGIPGTRRAGRGFRHQKVAKSDTVYHTEQDCSAEWGYEAVIRRVTA